METIIVELSIGAIGKEADFMLPAHIPVSNLIKDLTGLIEQAFQNVTFADEDVNLFDLLAQRIIPPSYTLAQANICDGHKLMIV